MLHIFPHWTHSANARVHPSSSAFTHKFDALNTCVIWQTHASMSKAPQGAEQNSAAIRLAIIGDVHGDWNSREDGQALQALDCDAAVFIGDFNEGEEAMPTPSQHLAIHKYAGVDRAKEVLSYTCP